MGAGIVGSVAGCLGTGSDALGTTSTGNETTDRMTSVRSGAEHLSFDHAKRLHRIEAGFPQRDVASYYLGLLRTDAHAGTFPTDRFDDAEAEAFVADTDYSEAALAVLHDRESSSAPDLELADVRRDGRALEIEAMYPGRGGTADITTDTLLVRVPTDGDPFRTATASVRPQVGEPLRFATANTYDVRPAFDPAGDFVLRNRDCANTPLSVRVTYEGDLFLRDGIDLPPATARRLGGVFTYPGEWTVTVRASGETIEQSWSLTDAPPGDVLLDVAGDGTISLSRRPDGVDASPLDTCETNGFPYESPNPSENLDHPVDLWVLDHADGEHHLTVTIREGDVEVYNGEFDTRAGYDKIQRAGLLAKMTTYTVRVSTATGQSVTETVTVREGVQQLAVRVAESGELSVSSA